MELYDSGTWWDGKIVSRSRKQPRKGRFQHRRERERWVYVVESVCTDTNSVSQDAWAVYDVESTSLRASLPSFHRTLQGLGREVREVREEKENTENSSRLAIPEPPSFAIFVETEEEEEEEEEAEEKENQVDEEEALLQRGNSS